MGVLSFDRYYLHCSIKMRGKPQVFMTLIYASTLAILRQNMWESISSLYVDNAMTWIIVGDFNDITCLSDQIGGSQQYVRCCSQHMN